MKRTTRAFFVPFILAILAFSTARGQQTVGKVLGISLTGNKTADASVIRLSSGLHVGQEIAWEDIQSAVKQLWALSIFKDVRIVLDRRTSEGLYLTIQVEEYPKLEKVEIKGNKKLKKEDIEKEISFFRGQVISPSQVTQAKRKVLKKYAEKGYTLAQIDHELVPSEADRMILRFDITEGRKVQIKVIAFHDNAMFKDGKLRRQMKKTKEDRWYRGADFDREKYAEDKEKVLGFYRNKGYRDAEIVRDSLYYKNENRDLYIDIWVQEGQRYTVGNISWQGNSLFTNEYLHSILEFQEGDVFSQEKFEKSIMEKIGGAYYNKGYIYASTTPKETVREGNVLDIEFLISEGKPVRINAIVITGNTRTKDRVIRREFLTRPGDVFSRDLLERSFRQIMMLNYFSNVVPEPVPVQDEQMDKIDIRYKVEEKSTDTANLSAGWSELDRLIGSIGLGMNNLFGNGQRLTLDWNFGRYYRAFSLSFTEPYLLNTPTLVGASIYDTKREPYYIGYSQSSRGVSLRLGRRFNWPDNYFRGDWIYRLDETELGDFSEYYKKINPNNIVYEEWPLTSSGITQILSRSSLNHPEFPTMGSRVSLTTEITGGLFGGNVGYVKNWFSAEFFLPIFSEKLVFLSRSQFAHMEKMGKKGKIPYLEYFFMGGSGLSRAIPLRGYDDPLAGGQYYSEGGKTMFQTTLEIRFPIISNPMAFGILFAEAGNTWIDIQNTDPFDLRKSLGIGARVYMPMIGMIGFDLAYGFDNVDAGGVKKGEWKTHFVFGRGF